MAVDLAALSELLQKGKAKEVTEMVNQALEEGMEAKTILHDGLMHGMNIIGEKFKNNEVFVPEVLIAARAMNMGTAILKPHLAEAGVEASGKVVIGTVKGDLHDIGKNLVAMMMEGKGLEIIDLGSDVPPQKFIEEATKNHAQIIACSALLTTTMTQMKDVVAAAQEAGIRDKIKIMVGGAPVTDSFCQQIGADFYSQDAASAASKAVEICQA
ncbi:MAG: cobalamin B12-binding domain-containing protein [Spirochaetota bacterium]